MSERLSEENKEFVEDAWKVGPCLIKLLATLYLVEGFPGLGVRVYGSPVHCTLHALRHVINPRILRQRDQIK
jgi:hypothetical protein